MVAIDYLFFIFATLLLTQAVKVLPTIIKPFINFAIFINETHI